MTAFTAAQAEAARAWLEEWAPGYSIGQWASLGELLAAQGAPPPPAAKRPGLYVYLQSAPNCPELDGTPAELYATSRHDADRRAAEIGSSLGAELRHVGYFADATSLLHRTFEAALPYAELPEWARSWIDLQRGDAVAKAKPRQRKKGKAA